MGSVSYIKPDERAEAYAAAVDLAKTCLGTETGEVNPNSRLGTLSDWEWSKLAYSMVSGWICARSRQLTIERFGDETFFLATGEVPEPKELGTCATTLPALGELVEKLGLTAVPIGNWSKGQMLLFIWTAAELIEEARTGRDERPGSVADLVMGG
jgi:hypothetical protein